MKRSFLLFLCFFFFFGIYAQTYNAKSIVYDSSIEENPPIYSRSIIYEYRFLYEKEGLVKMGKIYLGCLGTELKNPYQQQYEVLWTTDRDYLKQRIRNTGIIEDSARIWLHPPRMNEFSILEYSPFPQIKYPLQIGNKWTWLLTPGSNWVAENLSISEDDVLKYEFSIEDKIPEFIIPLHSYDTCFLVKGASIDKKKRSSFQGYYNLKVGFVKMIFSNRDGSIITLNLNDIIEWDKLGSSQKLHIF